MNVSPVGGTHNSLQTQTVQPKGEAAEVNKAGRDGDGDSDERKANAAKPAPVPTVNLSGQKLGQILNVSG